MTYTTVTTTLVDELCFPASNYNSLLCDVHRAAWHCVVASAEASEEALVKLMSKSVYSGDDAEDAADGHHLGL